jgi:hypothetical protein
MRVWSNTSCLYNEISEEKHKLVHTINICLDLVKSSEISTSYALIRLPVSVQKTIFPLFHLTLDEYLTTPFDELIVLSEALQGIVVCGNGE